VPKTNPHLVSCAVSCVGWVVTQLHSPAGARPSLRLFDVSLQGQRRVPDIRERHQIIW
jgi:hypothetical protein